MVFFDIRTLTLSPERQSVWMSKITNDGLTRSGTGYFIAVPMATVGVEKLISMEISVSSVWDI